MFNWHKKESPILSMLGLGGGIGSKLIGGGGGGDVLASGGTTTEFDDGRITYVMHSFTAPFTGVPATDYNNPTPGTFTVTEVPGTHPGQMTVLIVGGGGSGGAGGGGGGSVKYSTTYPLTVKSYPVVAGTCGKNDGSYPTGNTPARASSFDGYSAGGGGTGGDSAGAAGGAGGPPGGPGGGQGGSGGGASGGPGPGNAASPNPPVGLTHYGGYNGGPAGPGPNQAGGGGGATGAGTAPPGNSGGAGVGPAIVPSTTFPTMPGYWGYGGAGENGNSQTYPLAVVGDANRVAGTGLGSQNGTGPADYNGNGTPGGVFIRYQKTG